MRAEQINQLAALEDKLIDLFQVECTPEEWERLLKSKSAYSDKKNALATLRLVGQIEHLLRDVRPSEGDKADEKKAKPKRAAGDIEAEAAALEKQGIAVLKRHGKAGR